MTGLFLVPNCPNKFELKIACLSTEDNMPIAKIVCLSTDVMIACISTEDSMPIYT